MLQHERSEDRTLRLNCDLRGAERSCHAGILGSAKAREDRGADQLPNGDFGLGEENSSRRPQLQNSRVISCLTEIGVYQSNHSK